MHDTRIAVIAVSYKYMPVLMTPSELTKEESGKYKKMTGYAAADLIDGYTTVVTLTVVVRAMTNFNTYRTF